MIKFRHLALPLAVTALLGAPAFAQDVVVVPAPKPDAVVVVPADPSAPILVVPPVATPQGDTVILYESHPRDIITEPGGMTPRERADTVGQQDAVTGTITAPGYQGPRSTKGQ